MVLNRDWQTLEIFAWEGGFHGFFSPSLLIKGDYLKGILKWSSKWRNLCQLLFMPASCRPWRLIRMKPGMQAPPISWRWTALRRKRERMGGGAVSLKLAFLEKRNHSWWLSRSSKLKPAATEQQNLSPSRHISFWYEIKCSFFENILKCHFICPSALALATPTSFLPSSILLAFCVKKFHFLKPTQLVGGLYYLLFLLTVNQDFLLIFQNILILGNWKLSFFFILDFCHPTQEKENCWIISDLPFNMAAPAKIV